MDILLSDMPHNQFIFLFKRKLGANVQVELGEIEIVLSALIVKHAEQPSIQRNKVYLRPSSTNIKRTVFQLLSGFSACQAVRGQPQPGRGEISAPVFVRIAIGLLRRNRIHSSVKTDRSLIAALHSLRMPVHSEGLDITKWLAGTIANIESDLFINLQIPGELTGIAHPLRMLLRFRS